MQDDDKQGAQPWGQQTFLTHGGRAPEQHHGFINTPVMRGSTIGFPTLDALEDQTIPFRYGRTGNPSSQSVERIVTQLEGAADTVLAPSGLSAISTALLSVLKAGDELLLTDSAYEPTRIFCDKVLTRFGIETRRYDPRIGAGILDILSEKTAAIFVESPGSHTFEIQDLPAIAQATKDRDIAILVDNTWATPLFYRPLDVGADVVIHAGTKMFGGHSDIMFGTISSTADYARRVRETHRASGVCAAPDECFLAARGLRTLAVRMAQHHANALEVARWLSTQEGVTHVLHPGLESHPDHALFRRDFTGAGSLFSFILTPKSRDALAAFTDHLELFGLGFSWGGYESLALPAAPKREAVPWTEQGQLIRLHIGLEDVDDLKRDLAAGISRYLAH